MNRPIVESHDAVTLIGGGPASRAVLEAALALAPRLVAADGGAGRALALGRVPEAVIGDLDSLDEATRQALGAGRLHRVAEQETTDFDKALRHVAAPLVLGVGFLGGRTDHALAVLNVLARHPARRCLLLGTRDLCFLAPRVLRLRLRVGSRLSLFPMGPVRGTSEGLRWPIDGIEFAPGGRVGTSNVVSARQVTLRFSAPRMLVILPRTRLASVAATLAPGAVPAPSRGE